ncbi:hypothetical protein CGK17_16610 [Vibrio parahaemolyticus]|uniref:hypothetical protein n=1 Tax=Vibrio parahaemolyticus TaxID=670 RepID=UPI0011230837|nr:hypothetical protein [Vibrio parahaemolyticus]TOA90231.1 hypothetical protein CGK17_16610 [Vibrio parahaemolyticus]
MILEFITENKDLIGVLAVVFSGLFAFVKWLDTRKRELREKRYRTYMDLISIISGKRQDSSAPNITEQVAAVWFLVEYKEYYKTTVRIFSESDLENMANGPWVQHVLPHITKLIKTIG